MEVKSQQQVEPVSKPKSRALGGTENNWCRAVAGGTGVTVLAILVSKQPDFSFVQNALLKLQILHPILRSKLRRDPISNNFSFFTFANPSADLKIFDLSSTSHILNTLSKKNGHSATPLALLLEHELNKNSWKNLGHESDNDDYDLFFACAYVLQDGNWALMLRLPGFACDRTTAVCLLKDLLFLVAGSNKKEENVIERGGNKGGTNLAIEDLVPVEQVRKGYWARGLDMVRYSLNSLRQTNLKFKDVKLPRSSRVVRLHMSLIQTEKLLKGCASRGIKLCGALTAAVLLAAQSSKRQSGHQCKYGIVTLVDSRSLLNPPLSDRHFGYYLCPILNIHAVKGEDKFWELAKRSYTAFAEYKKSNRHFTDMADLNFLMSKAIDNPSLTQSSSLRTSLVSVFEDPVIDNCDDSRREIGLEDYMGASSVHGIGPSIGIFDTVRDGKLDCVCVYPSPLHLKEQMEELVDSIKKIIVNAIN